MRSETLLEQELMSRGFSLSHKTYTGYKNRKVDSYIYIKDIHACVYEVILDFTRNKIKDLRFTNYSIHEYSQGIIEGLKEVLDSFRLDINTFYDFEKNCVREIEFTTDFDTPIEESYFDD